MNIFWKVETKSFENAWPLKTFNYVLEKNQNFKIFKA